MIIKLAIWILAALGLVFVILPFFDYAVFDFQCVETGCSDQTCTIMTIKPIKTTDICIWEPEYGCNKDCKVYNHTCGFDTSFKDPCIECTKQCKETYTDIEEMPQLDQCNNVCYNLTKVS